MDPQTPRCPSCQWLSVASRTRWRRQKCPAPGVLCRIFTPLPPAGPGSPALGLLGQQSDDITGVRLALWLASREAVKLPSPSPAKLGAVLRCTSREEDERRRLGCSYTACSPRKRALANPSPPAPQGCLSNKRRRFFVLCIIYILVCCLRLMRVLNEAHNPHRRHINSDCLKLQRSAHNNLYIS
jgi:hypothetical protein